MNVLLLGLILMASSASGQDKPGPALASYLKTLPGTVAVAFKNLDNGATFSVRDKAVMHAASTMKLAVMIEVYRQSEQGRFLMSDSIPTINRFHSIVDGSEFSLPVNDDEKDPTFARFADIFHHRMLSLFYRAWANARPVVGHDRPADDNFPHYVGALFGLGMETQWQRDAMADPAKFHFAGLLACQTRHPDGLRAIIGTYLGLATDIQEFVGEWMDIPVRDQTRLGVSPAIASLGFSTVVGARVWGCQHKFRIVLGPMGFAQYRALLPGGETLSELVAIVRNYIGDELAWDVKLLLKADEVPLFGLAGNSLLGWTSWSGERHSTTAANDLCLNPFFRNHGKVDGRRREVCL